MKALFPLFACALLAGPWTGAPAHASGDAVQLAAFSAAAPGEELPGAWKAWRFGMFKRPTEYRLIELEGETVVRAVAESSASGLEHVVNINPRRHPLLSWKWLVTELIEDADNTQRQTEDSPVRLIIAFEGDKSKLTFDDQMFFDQVKAFTGRDMPYATLMYIWENRQPVGTVIDNQHTARIKMVVAESGADKIGQWQELTRNIREDFMRAYGEEPGRIVSVGIMTDTDNTSDFIGAYYGDIQFLPEERPTVAMR